MLCAHKNMTICYASFQIAAILTLPFDVIKTHRQISLGERQMLSKQLLCGDSYLI